MTSGESSIKAGRCCLASCLAALLVVTVLPVSCGAAWAAGDRREPQGGNVIYEFLLVSSNGEPASAARVRVMGVEGELPEAAFHRAGADGRRHLFLLFAKGPEPLGFRLL